MTAVGQISVYNHDYNLHISPRQLTMKAHTQLWDAAMHRGPGSIGGSVQIWQLVGRKGGSVFLRHFCILCMIKG